MKLSCHIVMDLLPSYRNDSVSDKTREDIQMHLEECMKCRELYNMPHSKTKSPHSEKRIFFISKELAGIIVFLFVLIRFILAHEGISSLLQHEAKLHILIVSGVSWFLCKNMITVKQRTDKLLVIAHIVIVVVSVLSVVMLYNLLTLVIDPQSAFLMRHIENKADIYYFAVWLAGIACILVVGYGLYASTVKSKNYCSLVSHGFGSAVMLFFILRFILNKDLVSDALAIPGLIKSTVFPYAEGVVLTLIYFLYGKLKQVPYI